MMSRISKTILVLSCAFFILGCTGTVSNARQKDVDEKKVCAEVVSENESACINKTLILAKIVSVSKLSNEEMSPKRLIKANILYVVASPEKDIYDGQLVEIVTDKVSELFGVIDNSLIGNCFAIIYQSPFSPRYSEDIKVYKTLCINYPEKIKKKEYCAVVVGKIHNAHIVLGELEGFWQVKADIVDFIYMPTSKMLDKGSEINLFVHSVVNTFLCGPEEVGNRTFLIIYWEEFEPNYSGQIYTIGIL